ncbi:MULTISPECIES: hypothetical protein [unclassified Streptomyces]|uniref:hypothetical protein n=1 Tax=unclassified Streptomyces TaxID=2593676 RepID=UPI002475FF3B|nr:MULTISPECIES: hypothetical protein [unclassified Streptomyces]MDH6449897.1 hypothetical protein [Streptomyces sp. SAI-119]MDH6499653.1 hypothetical protein [Streptomyces sp. SAI-149]
MRTGTAPDAPAPRAAGRPDLAGWLDVAGWLDAARRLAAARGRAAVRGRGTRLRLGVVRMLIAVRPLLRPRRPAAPVRPSRPDQLRALVAVLDEAVAAQTPADQAVAACGEPGPVSNGTARDCGRQSITLHRLRTRLQDLGTTEPDLVAAQARAARLLAYDLWMLRASMNLTCTVRPVDRTEAARLRLNGLGRPADDLRRLRDTLRTELRDRPGGGKSL